MVTPDWNQFILVLEPNQHQIPSATPRVHHSSRASTYNFPVCCSASRRHRCTVRRCSKPGVVNGQPIAANNGGEGTMDSGAGAWRRRTWRHHSACSFPPRPQPNFSLLLDLTLLLHPHPTTTASRTPSTAPRPRHPQPAASIMGVSHAPVIKLPLSAPRCACPRHSPINLGAPTNTTRNS